MGRQRCTLSSFGDPDWHCDFTPDPVAIFKCDGTVVADRDDPRTSFASHDKQTPWDPLHLAYFDGCALWTCLITPFLLTMEGIDAREVDPWNEVGETWRVLRARLPTRRWAYLRGLELRPAPYPLMVSIDISNVRFS